MNDSERPSDSSFPLTNNSARTGAKSPSVPSHTVIRAAREARPRAAWTYTKWTLALVFFCLLPMTVGTAFGNFYWRSEVFRTMVRQVVSHPLQTIKKRDLLAAYSPELQFPPEKQHIVNVMLVGADHDYEDRRPVPILTTNGRSDALLVARFDLDHNTIKVLSIPRDTAVRIPGHGLNKINAAYAIGGPELTQETIQSVFGIDTDFYVGLNFEGFQKVVDAIGGVDVTVHKQLDYDDNWGNLHVHLKPGYQHLNGYHAMGYVRIRHSDNDLMRAERQHEFLEALRAKVKSPSAFLKLPVALDKLMASIKTNLTQDQLLTLANYARKLPKENIELATLPCTEGPSYVYINVPQSAEVIRKMFFDNNLVAVNINAPERSEIPSLGHYGRYLLSGRHHRRRHGHAAAAAAPREGSGEPVLADPDTGLMNDSGAAGIDDSGSSTDRTGDANGGTSDGTSGAGDSKGSGKSDGGDSGTGNRGTDSGDPGKTDHTDGGGEAGTG